MAKNKKFTVKLKRKRTQKTDYNKRLAYVKSKKTRLVIRPHTNNITLQFIEYAPQGDKVIVTTHSQELKKLNWDYHLGNIPTAYLTGLLCGKKAKQKNVKEAILDLGLHKSVKGTRIYAALKGVVDAGLKVPHAEKVFPPEEVLEGKSIERYANLLSKNPEKHQKQFSTYIKKSSPEKISQKFREVKHKILS